MIHTSKWAVWNWRNYVKEESICISSTKNSNDNNSDNQCLLSPYSNLCAKCWLLSFPGKHYSPLFPLNNMIGIIRTWQWSNNSLFNKGVKRPLAFSPVPVCLMSVRGGYLALPSAVTFIMCLSLSRILYINVVFLKYTKVGTHGYEWGPSRLRVLLQKFLEINNSVKTKILISGVYIVCWPHGKQSVNVATGLEKHVLIVYFYFWLLGLCCCVWAFSSGGEGWPLSRRGARASRCGGFLVSEHGP